MTWSRRSLTMILLVSMFAAAAELNPVRLFPVVIRFIFHIKKPASPRGQADKKETPGQSFGLREASIHPAKERCVNWSWAAAVETLLDPSGVQMTQGDWVTK